MIGTERSASILSEFRLVGGLPTWRYSFDGVVIEKRLFMPNEQNTILITYKVVRASERIRLNLRPHIGARMHEAPVTRVVPHEPVTKPGQRVGGIQVLGVGPFQRDRRHDPNPS